jgi:hypothetical protein
MISPNNLLLFDQEKQEQVSDPPMQSMLFKMNKLELHHQQATMTSTLTC